MASRSNLADSEVDASLDDAAPGANTRSKTPQIVGLLLGCGLVAGSAWFFLREPEPTPAFRLKQALRYLDEHRDQAAQNIAQELEDINYQDPDFAGGVAFVLGICAFREAGEDDDEESREQDYLIAGGRLREAETLELISERRAEWVHALGVSLHRVGSADEALPLLEEAVVTYPDGKIEASLLLAETYLYPQTAKDARKALAVNTEVSADPHLSTVQRDRALQQRAQILLALGRRDEARKVIADVSRETSGNQAALVLRAQTSMAEGKYREAIDILKPVASSEGLDRTYPSQACYLTGLCWEKLDRLEKKKQGQLETALTYYERTIERFERSHEALAARMGAADALRKLGRNQEALERYSEVLRSIRRPRTFRNRWISLKKVREIVLQAWDGWVENDFYSEAITLAESMSPVVPRDEAYELAARASQRWAEHLDAEIAKLPFNRQVNRQEEVKIRWKRSGEAYARLADARKTSSAYANTLWTSAEDFLKGHAFANAVDQLNAFIDLQNTAFVPAALVRRGQALMDLDRLDAALRDFEETIEIYPTDPAAFQAQYLIGQCRFERAELDLAEKAWRRVLESPDLSPTALEWRRSLFALGKLLYHTAALIQQRDKPASDKSRPEVTGPDASAPIAGQPVASADVDVGHAESHRRWEEAAARLQEFLNRYPGAPEVSEARFLLAKSLQRSADLPLEKLNAAETENARGEFRRQAHEMLDHAAAELRRLQADLRIEQAKGTLDLLGQAMLRNTYIEIAHTLFALGRYEEAIAAYTGSAGNYQERSDSLAAYVQIANCYDRLQKPTEALSTLAQAQLILNKLPDNAFPTANGAMTRQEWQRWITWAIQLHE